MKSLHRILALIVAAVSVSAAMVSCGGTKGGNMNETEADINTEALADEPEPTGRRVEPLNRGVVAIKSRGGNLVSWRSFGTESADTVYELYRDGELIYTSEVGMATCFLDQDGTEKSKYSVKTGGEMSAETVAYAKNFFDIKLDKPKNAVMPDRSNCFYTPNDCSCGDLDGDGEYELIVKWDPSNAQDNSKDGYTGNVYLDAYKLDGKKLWRIDLGVNIRAGAHYTQFLVFDFDGDGKSELVCKTADGSVDGKGNVIGKEGVDYRTPAGRILSGKEYLTIFKGETGEAIETIDYVPPRGSVDSWGDNYGNRCDRFLAAVAYLDGKTPSLIMCRGYYTRAVLAAYNFDGEHLNSVWTFDSNERGCTRAAGQGNHNLCIADVDVDGFDEIVYGQCCIDHDGTLLWSTNLGHGDAVHVGDFLPDREGLEIWGCLEGGKGAYLADAKTGKILRKYQSNRDVGRALADNFISGNDSAEFVCATTSTVFSGVKDIVRGVTWNGGINFAVWFTGNLERCGLDGTNVYSHELGNVLSMSGVTACNGSKATPCLTADLLGDWREEIVMAGANGNFLRVFLTNFETEYRLPTLMHNTMYRCGVANENVAYNIPPHTEWFLDTDYPLPEYPDVHTVKAK